MTVVQELTGLDTAVELGAERLLSLQHPDGWWKGELESNATMIAEHLFLHHFLGLRDSETDRLLANELLARRRADGTWSPARRHGNTFAAAAVSRARASSLVRSSR